MLSPNDEMYEKALGYVQLLKLEGKLDEEVITELQRMYELDHADAASLLKTFKTERQDVYKAQIKNNIIWALGPLAICIIIAIIYIALGDDAGGGIKSFSWGYALLFIFGALGMLAFIFQLFKERIMMLPFFWEKDHLGKQVQRKGVTKRVAAVSVLFFIAIGAFIIIMIKGDIVFDQSKMKSVSNVVLEENCKEIAIRKGKSTNHYYQFKIMDNPKAFWWAHADHLYQFINGNNPDKYFKAGDTISLLIDKQDLINDLSDPEKRNTVYDAWKKGEESMLDKAAWGTEATANFRQSAWIFAALLSGLSLILIFNTKHRKDKLVEDFYND